MVEMARADLRRCAAWSRARRDGRHGRASRRPVSRCATTSFRARARRLTLARGLCGRHVPLVSVIEAAQRSGRSRPSCLREFELGFAWARLQRAMGGERGKADERLKRDWQGLWRRRSASSLVLLVLPCSWSSTCATAWPFSLHHGDRASRRTTSLRRMRLRRHRALRQRRTLALPSSSTVARSRRSACASSACDARPSHSRCAPSRRWFPTSRASRTFIRASPAGSSSSTSTRRASGCAPGSRWRASSRRSCSHRRTNISPRAAQPARTPRARSSQRRASRLKVLGMTDAEIRAIEKSGRAAPAGDRHRAARRGRAASRRLRRNGRRSFDRDPHGRRSLARLGDRRGSGSGIPQRPARQHARRLEFPTSGREPFDGQVEFIYPTLTERTRTLRVRFAGRESDGALAPGHVRQRRFPRGAARALTVPRDAVVDTGETQHVFVVERRSRFEPRR